MEYTDSETKEKFIPYIIESTVGADRLVLTVLFDAYRCEELEDGTEREYMKFVPSIAPYKVAVLPLIKKNHSVKAQELYEYLTNYFDVAYDESGSIGKRYRRQDISGTPFCITIDEDTLNNNTVTVRDRDTMKQDVIKIEDLVKYINDKLM